MDLLTQLIRLVDRLVQLVRVQTALFPYPLTDILPVNITATSGPNGNIDWINCGIADGGWKPPFVRISDIVTVELSSVLEDSASPFQACTPYVSTFEKYGEQFKGELYLFRFNDLSCLFI